VNVLITAGNTLVPIDRVRCLTNVFTGRTGAGLALHAHGRGHAVTLLTSHPEVVSDPAGQCWEVHSYRTFEDLHQLLEKKVRAGPDAVIHSAAVSDYLAGGVYTPAPGTRFLPETNHWQGDSPAPALTDVGAGKVKSDAPELWLRLIRAPKLVDLIRPVWGFAGVLVKFKLEVGVGEERLVEIAEQSRRHSGADLMVANTLEGAAHWAYVGPLDGRYRRVGRKELAASVLEAVENLHRERSHA
jgi:phosphopantothenoylcysteine synthetase/decarboxylase